MKKLLVLMLTLAMVLGMNLTANAAPTSGAPYNADITVNGLVDGESTTVNVYQAIALDGTENEWLIADWAADYVSEDTTNHTYYIAETDKADLMKAAEAQNADAIVATATVEGTSATFTEPWP